jgi:hypothetical protein
VVAVDYACILPCQLSALVNEPVQPVCFWVSPRQKQGSDAAAAVEAAGLNLVASGCTTRCALVMNTAAAAAAAATAVAGPVTGGGCRPGAGVHACSSHVPADTYNASTLLPAAQPL